ncbi:MAG: hypothetical protein ACHQF0_00340 [Chitinophagales bacterium]
MNAIIDSNVLIDNKQAKYLNFFWVGFLIYMLSFMLSRTGLLPSTIFQGFQIIGFVSFLGAALYLIKVNVSDVYLKVIFFIYLVWSVIVIIRGFSFDYEQLKRALFNADEGLFLYLAPLILLFPQSLTSYKKLFDFIFISGIFYILLDAFFIRNMMNADETNLSGKSYVEYFSGELGIQSCFILLCYSYQSIKKKLFALIIIAVILFFATLWGRRGLMFMCAAPVVFAYILYLFHSRTRILVVLLSALMIFIASMYAEEVYNRDKNVFSLLLERIDEDTRTGVEVYFYNDMNAQDWLIGRGMNGEYYCPDIDEDQITDKRSVIETGYLQVILKGGILSLGLYLLITVPAMIMGIFYSKNILSKAAGIWIFLALIYSYPTIINIFSFQYLLVWICVGLCYTKSIRMMPENEMKEYFKAIT